MKMIKGARSLTHYLNHSLTHSLTSSFSYYDDVAISQDEVRKLVLKSLNLDGTVKPPAEK